MIPPPPMGVTLILGLFPPLPMCVTLILGLFPLPPMGVTTIDAQHLPPGGTSFKPDAQSDKNQSYQNCISIFYLGAHH